MTNLFDVPLFQVVFLPRVMLLEGLAVPIPITDDTSVPLNQNTTASVATYIRLMLVLCSSKAFHTTEQRKVEMNDTFLT
jgi:hypothetical protein